MILIPAHPASLSRDLQSSASLPSLLHSLHELESSVLSLAANESYIFSGSQSQDISVWDKRTFTLKYTLEGHTGSVLALEYAKEKDWLFSSSGTHWQTIWSTTTLTTLYILVPYLETDAGDLFSLSWSPSLQTIYIGCQNTSLQWLHLSEEALAAIPISSTDSASGSVPKKPADLMAKNGTGAMRIPGLPDSDTRSSAPVCLNIPAKNVIDSAHYGYIYCMTIVRGSAEGDVQLATGSGDETVKLWDCKLPTPVLIHEFECTNGAILALDGHVKVLDLETKTLVRTIIVQERRLIAPHLAGARGNALSSIVTHRSDNDSNYRLITDTMTYALSKFVSIPSVSSTLSHREDCRQAAIWLRKCLSQLGARTVLLPTGEGRNPLVLGTFAGTKGSQPKRRLLFYGHYDVIPAPSEGWKSDPFSLTGRNGYLYGRGITDDKGPIMAVACAAADLLARRALDLDLVFLIEGEEECGSTGFGEAVRKHKDSIGHIDSILVSNSTWIAEDRPCITYGLRGVVHCALEITSALPDLHSGVEGGAVSEPMLDMVKLLATLTDSKHQIKIPEFYDRVRPQTDDETSLYQLLSQITGRPATSLSSRWREPSLTLHTIEMSGPQNATVIPHKVKSQVSLRLVPDQDLDTILHSTRWGRPTNSRAMADIPSQIKVEHTADWWLGNLDDPWFKALESAVQEEWGIEPLRIREGGYSPGGPVYPVRPYLEKEFGCHALHLPMGQSSDQAHLPNERISLENLQKGKAVVERFLVTVGKTMAS
ncbi:hypothetical protein BD779DRAFT_1611627 [Infundibulicybe gibba]|nr:hypothetical protein BD779DRAFT_1611627 [Infundibulicybe gibba]